ncbi:GPP34 family phosphoprotein [Streptomonospora nanhaiensis]|uniref:GPP34 family phosphoprotein n=1 Tax=Streptomonospora nanhaiensis TaxID=1323731 RepID=UPI0015CE4495
MRRAADRRGPDAAAGRPRSGAFAGEGGALPHTLAGAALVEVAGGGRVDIDPPTTARGRTVRAAGAAPPAGPLLREVWERAARDPADVQALVLRIGPVLRAGVPSSCPTPDRRDRPAPARTPSKGCRRPHAAAGGAAARRPCWWGGTGRPAHRRVGGARVPSLPKSLAVRGFRA